MNKITLYGFLTYDANVIWKYLKKDIDDDWFQDPIKYSDYIKINGGNSFFEANIMKNFGRYQSTGKEIYYLPKGDFTLRYTLETNFYDRFMYFCLVVPLIKMFDKLITPRVFSSRYSNDNEYLFRSPIKQWERFEGIIRCQSIDKYILSTDIQNYYENIKIDLLRYELEGCLKKVNPDTKELIEKRFIIDRLTECLQKWSYDGERGLAQNRDCSSFLANIYMKPIDEEMLSLGYNYYRYMDDIRIICEDEFTARRALRQLVILLRDKNLSVNGKKTKFLKPGTKEHDELLRPSIELKKIESLLSTKKKANVAIGYTQLKKHLKNLIKLNRFDDKGFRYCINRLSILARCKDYKVPDGFWDDLIGGIIDAIISCPTCTDRIYEFISAVGIDSGASTKIIDFICDSSKSIYEWQNYLLWKLLIISGVHEELLISRAVDVINSCMQIPNKAGAILYLAHFGDKSHKLLIKDSISKDDSIFLQRHKLLACKGLDWIKDNVQEKKDQIHDCLKNTYKIINKEIDTILMKPRDTKLTDIIRSYHQYD